MELQDTKFEFKNGWACLLCGEVVVFRIPAVKYLGCSLTQVHQYLWCAYEQYSKPHDEMFLRSLRISPINVNEDVHS
jgi:hypothetical protein